MQRRLFIGRQGGAGLQPHPFYRKPKFNVQGYHRSGVRPKIQIDADDTIVIALQLAKVWHVTPDRVLETPADLVIAGLLFEKFTIEYQEKYLELTKESK